MTACKTCELTKRRDDGDAPLWDAILRTPGWDLAHAYDSSLEGWLVLVARRHIQALADLTEDEAAELGPLIRRVSRALQQVTGCEKTYMAQFADHPDHRHVHIHLMPRATDHPPEVRGPRVFALIGETGAAHVSEARKNELAEKLKRALAET